MSGKAGGTQMMGRISLYLAFVPQGSLGKACAAVCVHLFNINLSANLGGTPSEGDRQG